MTDLAPEEAPEEAEEDTGPPDDRTFEFRGDTFRVADRISAFAMIKFQRFADTADPRAMIALYQLLEAIVHPDDWQRFEDTAITTRANDEDLIDVISAGIDVITRDVARRNQQARAIPQDHLPPQKPRQAVRQPRTRQARRK